MVSEAGLLALKDAVVLEHLHLALLAVFLLDLLDDVIVVVVLLLLGQVSEASLADAKSWFLDDQVRVFFLLFYHAGRDVVVDQVVAAHCWLVLLFLDELAVDL